MYRKILAPGKQENFKNWSHIQNRETYRTFFKSSNILMHNLSTPKLFSINVHFTLAYLPKSASHLKKQ